MKLFPRRSNSVSHYSTYVQCILAVMRYKLRWLPDPFFQQRIAKTILSVGAWTKNYIHMKIKNVIAHPRLLNIQISLLWRHNGHNSVSNHQPYDCLLRRLFRRRSKQTSKPRVTGLCAGNSPGPVNFPHKWPVTRKMFPFDDVIMLQSLKLPAKTPRDWILKHSYRFKIWEIWNFAAGLEALLSGRLRIFQGDW